MVEILGLRARSKKKAVHCSDRRFMELEAAKEILAEVFRISIKEVEAMILNRFEPMDTSKTTSGEDGLWPQEFSISGV